LSLCLIIKIDLIKLLSVIKGINDGLPTYDQGVFFGTLLLSEIFHSCKAKR
jgi:hypothetical protein